MYQGEEPRCNKCCGKSADIIWSVATPHLVRSLRRKEVIRIVFRDGTHENVSCEGRTLRVVKHDGSYVIYEEKKDGKLSRVNENELAFFPCDVVQSIIRTTV